MKKRSIVIIFAIFAIFFIISNVNITLAESIQRQLYGTIYSNPLYKPAGIIVGIIKWGGVAILVGAIIVKGIKFVCVSPEGKADIKKQIVMLTIGAFLLFATTELIDMILDFVKNSGITDITI